MSISKMAIGTTFQFTPNCHYQKSSVKYASQMRMFNFYVKTVYVIIATSSVFNITRKTSHVLVVWDLVMRNIFADEIHQVWSSKMRHNLKKIRKESITLE